MAKYATNSWQAREALVERRAYSTGGAMYATEGPQSLPWGHRLPAEWAERYEREASRMTYVVWSYSTPIAWVLDDDSVIKVDHKWSITTSGHQGMLYALDASRGARAGIFDAAAWERQNQRDRRAQTQENVTYRSAPAPTHVSGDAMRSAPTDYDELISSVQGMPVR